MTMMGGKHLLRGIGALGLAIMLAGAVLMWIRRSNPVFLAFSTSVLDSHGTQLLNPFRGRAPEHAAARFLGEIGKGECASALRAIGGSEKGVSEVCAKESQYRLVGWRLAARQDDGERASLRYDVERRGGKISVRDPVWITVKVIGRAWTVATYEAWY